MANKLSLSLSLSLSLPSLSPIYGLTVASHTPFVIRKNHKTAPPTPGQIFTDAKTEVGALLPLSALRGLTSINSVVLFYVILTNSTNILLLYLYSAWDCCWCLQSLRLLAGRSSGARERNGQVGQMPYQLWDW